MVLHTFSVTGQNKTAMTRILQALALFILMLFSDPEDRVVIRLLRGP